MPHAVAADINKYLLVGHDVPASVLDVLNKKVCREQRGSRAIGRRTQVVGCPTLQSGSVLLRVILETTAEVAAPHRVSCTQ